ncbi:hypothetical protein Cgig2_017177 [Carnegiea gigantea]|uniref:Uncharacterized protein n=1 Tax=Carnegiea gigantea TaxID=171969 RepID=A0A9Q1K9X7_9CARY|nr:hypothetical protein Cgig2_017177 [Carnegiea gigantea]
MANLNATTEGEVSTFLAIWLVALSFLRVKNLVEIASHPAHLDKANKIVHSYYITGWLAKLFPCLSHHLDSDCLSDFHIRLVGSRLSLPQTTHVSREGIRLSLRATYLNTIEICWLSSNIKEIIAIVETVAQIKKIIDVDRVKFLSDQDLTFSSEIVHIKGELSNLPLKLQSIDLRSRRP